MRLTYGRGMAEVWLMHGYREHLQRFFSKFIVENLRVNPGWKLPENRINPSLQPVRIPP